MLGILINAFGGIVLKLVWRLVAGVLGKVLESTVEIAQVIVAELNETALSSDEKRAEAFRRIAARMLAEGVEVSKFVINLSIELAVAGLKEAQGYTGNAQPGGPGA